MFAWLIFQQLLGMGGGPTAAPPPPPGPPITNDYSAFTFTINDTTDFE